MTGSETWSQRPLPLRCPPTPRAFAAGTARARPSRHPRALGPDRASSLSSSFEEKRCAKVHVRRRRGREMRRARWRHQRIARRNRRQKLSRDESREREQLNQRMHLFIPPTNDRGFGGERPCRARASGVRGGVAHSVLRSRLRRHALVRGLIALPVVCVLPSSRRDVAKGGAWMLGGCLKTSFSFASFFYGCRYDESWSVRTGNSRLALSL